MTYIFIFNNTSRAANYGVGTYIQQLSRELSVCPNIVVSFIDMYSEVKEFVITNDEQGFRHYQIPASPTGRESDIYCRCQFYLLARHINVDATDKIVFHFNYFHHITLALLLKGHFHECRIVLTVHYMNWCFELNGNLSQFRKFISNGYEPTNESVKRIITEYTNEQRFLHFADEVFVLSKKTFSILCEDYKVDSNKLHLIYNGAGCEPYPNPTKHTSIQNILFMGRLDEIKGLKYLIGAFEKIASQYPKTHLTIAGDGNFQPYLEQSRTLQGRITFLGRIQGKDVEDAYHTAHIGVMPSFHEQCSYTAIEMMRHGIPFIGTDSTGLAEMLDATPWLRIHIDEDNFCEEDFVLQIVDRLDKLLSDKTVYLQASSAVSDLYEKRYKSSYMAQATITAISTSFCRMDYALSSDYLSYIDERMKQLVEQQPDIDTDFFGISGIAVYLWWRLCNLQKQVDKDEHKVSLHNVLEQCLLWIQKVLDGHTLPEELMFTLFDMKEKAYNSPSTNTIWTKYDISQEEVMSLDKKHIIHNALKICNCKI